MYLKRYFSAINHSERFLYRITLFISMHILIENTWLLDLEKCCSFLIGRILGNMLLVGVKVSPEEFDCSMWTHLSLFRNGLEIPNPAETDGE